MDTRIYVCTHLKFNPPDNPMYIPLHVGREISMDLGYMGDNTGENISSLNKNWCELTGYYWIWKNTADDVVGVCHYRRFLSVDGRLLNRDDVDTLLSEYDLLLPESMLTEYDSLYDHYCASHYKEDIVLIRKIIEEETPEYLQAFDIVFSCNLFSVGNIVITRREHFDNYCSWLFSILFKLKDMRGISEYDDYQKRIYGFISERLLRVWVMNHPVRVKELQLLTQ